MSSRTSNNQSHSTPSNLVSLPSLSSGLYALPQATHIDQLALHPHMYAHRAAESEALLQKALSKTAANLAQNPQNPPPSPYTYYSSAAESQASLASSPCSSPLMMRTKKSKS